MTGQRTEQGGGCRVAGVEGRPVPGHLTVIPDTAAEKADDASVLLADGRALSGRVVRLDCDARILGIVERGMLTQGDLDAGLARQRLQRESRFGEYLCRCGLATPQQVGACLITQKVQGQRKLGELLVERGLMTAAQRDLALAGFALERVVVDAFPAELARRHLAMPRYRAGSHLAVALANPVSWEAVEDVGSALRRYYGPA